MSAGPQVTLLPDGKRLHLHHGPIDLICGADGGHRERCFAQATRRFETLLDELVPELPVLRAQVCETRPNSPVGQRMREACLPHSATFVTPMASVAGAVADEVLSAMMQGTTPRRAYVNNGGDIAFTLAQGAVFTALGPAGEIRLQAGDGAGGLATSGWSGRSFSLGIADAVTVVARNAAEADVAATLIANAVDLPGHPAITRVAASDVSPDSDLGARCVTTDVGPLHPNEARTALRTGQDLAFQMMRQGVILQAVLSLQGQVTMTKNKEVTDA